MKSARFHEIYRISHEICQISWNLPNFIMKSIGFHEICQISCNRFHEIRRISWKIPNKPRTNGPIFQSISIYVVASSEFWSVNFLKERVERSMNKVNAPKAREITCISGFVFMCSCFFFPVIERKLELLFLLVVLVFSSIVWFYFPRWRSQL